MESVHSNMKRNLEQHPDFPTFSTAKDPTALVQEMRNIVCGCEAHMHDAWSLCKLIKFMLSEWQREGEPNQDWMERFHSIGKLLSSMGQPMEPPIINQG